MGMYGVVLARHEPLRYQAYFSADTYYADVVIMLAFGLNAAVKFKHHVLERRPFDDFWLKGAA